MITAEAVSSKNRVLAASEARTRVVEAMIAGEWGTVVTVSPISSAACLFVMKEEALRKMGEDGGRLGVTVDLEADTVKIELGVSGARMEQAYKLLLGLIQAGQIRRERAFIEGISAFDPYLFRRIAGFEEAIKTIRKQGGLEEDDLTGLEIQGWGMWLAGEFTDLPTPHETRAAAGR